MKKRIISLLLASVMLLSMTSCKKEELNYAEMTLEEYIDKVKLPENLTISIDPATVKERETAKVYTNLEYMDFDLDTLAELMLQAPVTDEEVWAEGSEYIAKTNSREEYLTAYDGGEAYFGEDGQSVDGGFFYLQYLEEETALTATFPDSKEMYDAHPMQAINCFRGIYQSADKELDFASREEIAEKATTLLKDAGLPDVEAHEIMAYDTEAIKAAVEYGSQDFEKKPEVQKSDEHYYVLCRQLIDEIPINTYRMADTSSGDWSLGYDFYLKYSQDGLIDGDAVGLIQPPTDGTEEELITAVDALECLKEYYSQGILLKPYTVEDMELVYIARYQGDNTTVLKELHPFWLIKTSYQQDYPSSLYTDYDGNALEGEIKAYDFTYFDAVTGEYFEGSTSGKPIE